MGSLVTKITPTLTGKWANLKKKGNWEIGKVEFVKWVHRGIGKYRSRNMRIRAIAEYGEREIWGKIGNRGLWEIGNREICEYAIKEKGKGNEF